MTHKTNPVLLVVEDEPLLRMMAVDLAQEAGFEVIQSANAAAAIALLENRLDIRIVFTDIDMPGALDGMQLAVCIRDRWPPIELVITSGHCAPDPRVLPDRAVFFAKPYDPEQVASAICRMAAETGQT